VQDLRTSYGDVGPVRGISFDLNVDQTFALLGPNGVGESTTIEILEGCRGRDSGEVSVLGVDPHRGVNEVIDVRRERPPPSSHPCDGARPA
jgi:ABC-2 type transport system ATP-binding protein